MAASQKILAPPVKDEKSDDPLKLLAEHLCEDLDEKKSSELEAYFTALSKNCPQGRFKADYNAPAPLRDNFEFGRAINIAPRNPKKNIPRLAGLFFTTSEDQKKNAAKDEQYAWGGYDSRYFTLYSDKPNLSDSGDGIYSSSLLAFNICVSPYLEKPAVGCLRITRLNNHDKEYRHGSVLIQIAVECSLLEGLDGRIILYSTSNALGFYHKLGFVTNPNAVRKGEQQPFYVCLPPPAIEIWKEKIVKHPLLLTEEDIQNLCKKSEVQKPKAAEFSLSDFSLMSHKSSPGKLEQDVMILRP